MKLKKLVSLGAVYSAIIVSVGGCQPAYRTSYSPSYSTYSPSAPANNKIPSNVISVEDDQYKPNLEYTSDTATEGTMEDTTVWLLVARKDRKTGTTVYFAQWGNIYASDGWHFYSSANDSNANKLDFNEVDRDVGGCYSSGCVHTETYNIYFTPEQMTAGATSGINFKVFAQDGTSKMTTIPSTLVKAMLDKVNQPKP